ncbi:RagB/SusD family nutrient uptake outer membrane protein [Parabacteroides pacaensis]|uniref:RagB/SusD family nutrient uptake outer membrane protein n=1 Tax=Parabacteroides pacaensis TaxID=2086575 RepID=UPI000D0F6DF8|nr:RagB/SusD family nutrient uptake outer membrane protein [Parabacteroides pacaensis]
MKKKLLGIILFILPGLFFSCEDFLTVEPGEYVTVENSFKSADDAIVSIQGLYGLMQPLVDQLFLIGEAQGELTEAGRGADRFIAEFAQNRVTPQNPYTDYTGFYKLIVACNNTLEGLKKILLNDPVNYTQGKYEYNVVEIKYIRIWAYFQLVRIWKDVPYVEESITSVEQLKEREPVSDTEILSRIIREAEDNFAGIQDFRMPTGSGVTNVMTSRSQFTAQSARFLLTDMYLYVEDYVKAWELIRPVLPFGEPNFEQVYGIASSIGNSGYRWYDWVLSAQDKSKMFAEWCMYVDFDGSKGQKNNLQRWTNNKDGGIYALKPTKYAVDLYETTPTMLLQYQINEYYFDPRATQLNYVCDENGMPVYGPAGDKYRGSGLSYIVQGKDTVIFKYLLKEWNVARSLAQNDPNSNDDALFPLYRTGHMLLKVSEILNNMGMPELALYYLNGGDAGAHVQSTRARVKCYPFRLEEGKDPVEQVNRFILEEMALECSFEGVRWFDLVRFARRAGYGSWLGEYVSKKYPADRQAAIRAKLQDPFSWYLPYYQKNVDSNSKLVQKTGY